MKHWQPYIERQKPEYLQTKFPSDFAADIIVVIPCYNEKELQLTLQNLCTCAMPKVKTMVAVIINSGIKSGEEAVVQNRKTYNEVIEFATQNNTDTLCFFPLIFENLPRKHAGVGLARKIGMDLAVKHFLNTQNPNGIIISLDADCTVSPNFLTNIFAAYRQNDKLCCTVQNFHHRVENNDPQLKNAIRQYEQYIRYFSQMLRFIGFPYYYHTIGSAFSVSADTYVRVGGMGRQQGGEDFYFLQKVFALGKSEYLENVFVYPMARYSDRIPFGTGPALQKIIDEPDRQMRTYHFDSFLALKEFFNLRQSFFKQDIEFIQQKISLLHPAIVRFSEETNVLSEIEDSNQNSATLLTFEKRFFHHFNAFKIIKYLNFAHPVYFSLEKLPPNFETDKI
ncbi:MAG: glycosyltransferase family 2 protein [Bacteroidia bacterium]|nr:glycosyltransferase family 2 protein [Bacteroidia bacterium]